MTKEEFIKTCLNSDELFQEKPGMNPREKNEVSTKKMSFDIERFLTTKQHRESNLASILNPQKLDQFVGEVLNGEKPLYWASMPQK